jgi:hypothetical protein
MKVYISSTYQDLIEHRAAVDRALRRMGHDVIGMEQYVAEGSKPVERCKADVQASNAYVIIVAWRYGYVPGRAAPPTDTTVDGRSITEIELAEAQACGKPVLAFLLDPEAPWPPNRVDAMGGAPGAGDDVARLRTLLGANYLAGIFRTPDDLATQVAAAVSAQGLTRHMVDRVLGETSVASPAMDSFAKGDAVSDTTLIGIKQMIKEAGTARALVLKIDGGERWWSTRLFLLANLLNALTDVQQQLVFSNSDDRFVGMASPSAVIDGLRNSYIELDQLSMSQVQQIVDSPLRDVPVQRRRQAPDTGFQLLVVDRDAFALELAREWVRSGLPRTAVR